MFVHVTHIADVNIERAGQVHRIIAAADRHPHKGIAAAGHHAVFVIVAVDRDAADNIQRVVIPRHVEARRATINVIPVLCCGDINIAIQRRLRRIAAYQRAGAVKADVNIPLVFEGVLFACDHKPH